MTLIGLLQKKLYFEHSQNQIFYFQCNIIAMFPFSPLINNTKAHIWKKDMGQIRNAIGEYLGCTFLVASWVYATLVVSSIYILFLTFFITIFDLAFTRAWVPIMTHINQFNYLQCIPKLNFFFVLS
jgi:hypothetical protein